MLTGTEFEQQVNDKGWNSALLAALCGVQGQAHDRFLSEVVVSVMSKS
jgi:hypothetical protein